MQMKNPIKTLEKLYPKVTAEWNYKLNKLTPDKVSYGSAKKVWWICSKNKEHIWEAQINNRINGSGCPYCNNKKPSKDYSLAACYPDLISEWHKTKNIIPPTDVLPFSKKKVWWQCPVANDHEWQACPSHRTLSKSGCPCCRGSIITISNCLATTHPELVKCWSKKNISTPFDITHGSDKKVWWDCEKCEKSYSSTVSSKVHGHGCPKSKFSIGETKIKNYLEKNNIKYESQYRISNCKRKLPLPFDFAVFTDKIRLIEFQGELHYKAGRFSKGQFKFEKIQESDLIKKKYCIENNIELIEITYKDINNIEKILNSYFS